MSNNLMRLKPGDELYTPPILVEPILKHIDKSLTVWCPFDTEESEFVIALKERGNKVISSHIWKGQDFLEWEPEEHYDVIVSNPPFSIKEKVLRRAYSLNKPFALLLGTPILNYHNICNVFTEFNNDIQLMIPDKKVSFNGTAPSFSFSYFCRKIMPWQLEFVKLPHTNTGDNFTPSAMMEEFTLKNDPTSIKAIKSFFAHKFGKNKITVLHGDKVEKMGYDKDQTIIIAGAHYRYGEVLTVENDMIMLKD